MSIEAERKFVLPGPIPEMFAPFGDVIQIEQKYLVMEPFEVRLRRSVYSYHPGKVFFEKTIKFPTSETGRRHEFTVPLFEEEYDTFSEHAIKVINKTRYEIKEGVSVDLFPSGLYLLEIEEPAEFPLRPDWTEVTGQPEYYNATMPDHFHQYIPT